MVFPSRRNAHFCILGHLGFAFGYLGPCRGYLWPSWVTLGPSWDHLGAILSHLGDILGQLGTNIGPTWGHLGGYLALFGALEHPQNDAPVEAKRSFSLLGFKMAPRWPQDGPRWFQDGPRWLRIWCSRRGEAFIFAFLASRWLQDAPRCLQDGFKMEDSTIKSRASRSHARTGLC